MHAHQRRHRCAVARDRVRHGRRDGHHAIGAGERLAHLSEVSEGKGEGEGEGGEGGEGEGEGRVSKVRLVHDGAEASGGDGVG